MLMIPIILLPPAIGFLWLLVIRPYCIKHRKGYTPGFNIGATMWIDWQSAKETAKSREDQGMLTCCGTFLGLNILMLLSIIGIMFGD